MGPGADQGDFAFLEPRPLCHSCHRRSARPNPDGGFYSLCYRCWRSVKLGQRRSRAEAKAVVLAALGNCCSCPGTACWHPGPCTATHPDVLTVDHTDGSGYLVRRRRRDGSMRPRGTSAMSWPRYRDELRVGSRALRCLCHNCHHFDTIRSRRAALRS